MNYKEAGKIRKSSFGSLLAEQEGGLGQSFKKALSLKTKAKMSGIKESFDPMNIAKFMTGGSNLAPAIIGKLTGRSKEDVAHFTGAKAKSVGGDTATRIGSLEHDNSMMDVLMKIYTFMQKTHDDEKKLREEKNQFSEENALEKQKRHNELIKALTGKDSEIKTAEKIKKDTGMDQPDILTSILDSFGGAKTALSLISNIGKFFLMNPIGIGLLLGGSVLTLLAKDENPEETNKMIQGAMGGPTSDAQAIVDVVKDTTDIERRKQNILAARPSSKKSMLFWKDPVLQEKYLQEIGWDEKTGLTADEKKAGFVGIDEKGIPVKSKETSTETTPKPTASTAPASEPTPAATPVTTAPAADTKLAAVQSQNNDLNLPESKSDPATVVSNNINTSNKRGEPKGPIPTVRNQEETFQRMILNSTRVV